LQAWQEQVQMYTVDKYLQDKDSGRGNRVYGWGRVHAGVRRLYTLRCKNLHITYSNLPTYSGLFHQTPASSGPLRSTPSTPRLPTIPPAAGTRKTCHESIARTPGRSVPPARSPLVSPATGIRYSLSYLPFSPPFSLISLCSTLIPQNCVSDRFLTLLI
jgi:hypothetical protein